MIYDKNDGLCEEQVLGSGTTYSTDHKNFGGDFNVGVGEPLAVAVFVNTGAATVSGSGTFTFELETDSVNTFASPTGLGERTIAGSTLTEGSVHVLPIPADKSAEQFLRGKWYLAGSDPTITITAVIMPVKAIPATNIYYAAGSSVGT